MMLVFLRNALPKRPDGHGFGVGRHIWCGLLLTALCTTKAMAYIESDLVSDVLGRAEVTDANLKNPWGIAYPPTGPFWTSNQGTGTSTLYDGQGRPFPVGNPRIVATPPVSGTGIGSPTGVVFNGGTGFELGPNLPSRFIFSSEDGGISGWNSTFNAASAVVKATTPGAVYKGLAIANNGTGDILFGANFSAGKIDVFGSHFEPVSLAGSFVDANLPSGFAPFNIQNIGGRLLVTYAQRDVAGHDDVAGPGNGFVNAFDYNGNLLGRLVSQGSLNSPWGLALAPDSFGPLGGSLLIGNFGDGRINAFDPVTGSPRGSLTDSAENPIEIPGLWGLIFGNGASAGNVDELYFTAGIGREQHGLFGSIAVPEPTCVDGMSWMFAALATAARRTKQQRLS